MDERALSPIKLKGVLRSKLVTAIKKSVRFCKVVKVVLIPSRLEYEECGLGNLLWWRWGDIANFKDAALREIVAIRLKQPSISTRQALSHLYQPSVEICNNATAAF
jgi:hypothetical protein